MKLPLKKLNNHGFEHVFVLTVIVLFVAIVGTYILVRSNADGQTKVDISQPQCASYTSSAVKAGIGHYQYGIVGLNGEALDFATNPCAKAETKHFTNYDLYVGANYPSGDSRCAGVSAHQCGIAAADFDYNLASREGIMTSNWWIDVEGFPSKHPLQSKIPWSENLKDNANFLKGLYNELSIRLAQTYKPFKNSGQLYKIGFYSVKLQWDSIVGDNYTTTADNWYASGQGPKLSAAAAKQYCAMKFGGGKNVLVQYTNSAQLDVDLNC